MKLSVWAKQQGVTYLTAWRWYKDGRLPEGVSVEQMPSGTLIVTQVREKVNTAVVYARVSSYPKKEDLNRQADRLSEFCTAQGWVVEKVVKEVASGLNDSRPKLTKLLKDPPARLVVEHKDRLTRFGFNYFETLLPQLGCELIVLNRDEQDEADLMKDFIAIITSFCCRLYGLRRGQNKAARLKQELSCEEP